MPNARRFAKALLGTVGVRVGNRWEDPDWRRAWILRDRGVTVALDVGANVGQYGMRLRQGGYRGRIVSFEPYSKAHAALADRARADPGWETRRVALGDAAAQLTLTVAASTDCSSFLDFSPTSTSVLPGARAAGSETVRVVPLDDLRVLRPGDVALLKLDVQGYEPRVLAGARRTLEQVAVVECELGLRLLYEREPSLLEKLELLDALGFTPIRFEDGATDFRTGASITTDALLVRG